MFINDLISLHLNVKNYNSSIVKKKNLKMWPNVFIFKIYKNCTHCWSEYQIQKTNMSLKIKVVLSYYTQENVFKSTSN